ncbi:MAG: flagellar motor switch protein FliG [Rhizobiaceae bacterium]
MDHPVVMTNIQKAATILVAMGKARAGKLLKHFKNHELRRLIEAARSLPPISQPQLEDLVERFEDEFSAGTGLMDSSDAIKSIISETFTPEEFSALIEPKINVGAEADGPPVWEAVENVEASELAVFIAEEHPQTCAVVLSKLSSRKAAEIVASFDREKRKSVLKRMLALGEPMPAALAIVERHLRDQFVEGANQAGLNEGRVRVANVLNELDRENMEEVFDDLANDTDPDNIAAVKSLLFRFEDITALSGAARSTIFDGIATDMVVTALRGAEGDLSEAVLSSLGQRTRRMIESELANEIAVKADTVAAARREIASTAIRLASEGRIALPSAEQDEAA